MNNSGRYNQSIANSEAGRFAASQKSGGNQVKAAQHQSPKIKTQRQESQEFRRESLIEKTRRILELEKQGLLSKKEAEALIRRAVNDAVH